MGNQDGDVKALLERFGGGVPTASAAAAAVGKVNGPPTGLPPGFRFHPTDEELVLQYLRRKVFSRPLPADIIPDIELYKYEPWDLPLVVSGDNQKVRYYFNLQAPKYPNGGSGGRANRAAGSGYWKATGRDRPVLASKDHDRVVGMKKVLVFYRGKAPSGTRTDWVMHEYRLLPPAPPLPPAVPVGNNKLPPASAAAANAMPPPAAVPNPGARAAAAVPSPNWVLCRVFKKKKVGAARGREDMEDESDEEMEVDLGVFPHPPPNFIDFLGPPRTGGGAAYPSASESSCVTEAAASSEEVESGAEVGNGGGGKRSLFSPSK